MTSYEVTRLEKAIKVLAAALDARHVEMDDEVSALERNLFLLSVALEDLRVEHDLLQEYVERLEQRTQDMEGDCK